MKFIARTTRFVYFGEKLRRTESRKASNSRTIFATEFVQNFAKVIDQVRRSGKTLFIKKGTQTVATVSPPPQKALSGEALTELLESLPSPAIKVISP